MRDISTEDVVQTLIIKTQAHERALCIYAIHPTAQNANAVSARAREQGDALRTLNAHLRECLKIARRLPGKKPAPLKWKLTSRTINALKRAGVSHPEELSIRELLKIPGLGVGGVAAIAVRSYAAPIGVVSWPELNT